MQNKPCFLSCFYQKLSTAPDCSDERRRFKITHPFHPLYGQEFDLLWFTYAWGDERVMYRGDDGMVTSFPAGWTDILPPDPFVAISERRSIFHVDELLELVKLVDEMDR